MLIYFADSFSAGIDLGINIDFVQKNHGSALENLVKFRGKTCVEVSLKLSSSPQACDFIKKRDSNTGVFL